CWRGIADLSVSYPHRECVIESWGRGRRLGIVPLAAGKVYWFAVINAKEADPSMKHASQQDLLSMFEEFHPDYLSVLQQTPASHIFWSDLHDIKPIHQFAFGNILLAGDAAHATTPNMGQGGCQALEDAAVLMDVLQKDGHMERAFLDFESKRIPRTRRIIETSRNIGRMAHLQNPILVKLRNTFMKLIPEKATLTQLEWLNHTDF
ncbi:MAG TPA: FAD-dependent monooxygenase, partial [Cytophagales bacterium]|nr:FAD-dependent monooxygenase [Cytophagales bacterium]